MDIAKDITIEDLAAIRLWLLQKNKELEMERETFEREKAEFKRLKHDFETEKELVQCSLLEQTRSIEFDKKCLANEKRLLEQKLAILENGFRELCSDKEELEAEKIRIKREARDIFDNSGRNVKLSESCDAGVFFSGVDNMLALKKRYRDLLKIFHPDNIAGDNETIQVINREYALLKQNY